MRAAVLGSPVGHSLSPVLHRSAYAELGLDGWSYQGIECGEAQLPALLASLGADWAGLSLTMPLKRAVIGLLDWVSPLACRVGAVNTVVIGPPRPADGDHRGDAAPEAPMRRGYNTDVGGMADALAGAAPEGASALIIGGGATACSTLAALQERGLRKATVAVRSAGRAGELLATAERLGIAVELTDVESLGSTGNEAGPGLVVSTIPSGAADQLAGRLSALAPAAVMDVVYDPWPTPLAIAAEQAGAAVIGGFDLLLYQAARQVRLMTGLEPPIGAMRSAGLAELARRGS